MRRTRFKMGNPGPNSGASPPGKGGPWASQPQRERLPRNVRLSSRLRAALKSANRRVVAAATGGAARGGSAWRCPTLSYRRNGVEHYGERVYHCGNPYRSENRLLAQALLAYRFFVRGDAGRAVVDGRDRGAP
jgi:hypothetical protein